MTTKPPSGLAASGSAEDADPDITKDHNEDASSIRLDPSQDVTVEATEDVTQEAVGHTPPPSLRPGTAGVSPRQSAPTLLGVPIHSLPLPGVTADSASGEMTRTLDYDEEVTVLAPPEPIGAPLTISSSDVDLGPSIVDDDEEETKVEAAESAMKAAESMDDVTTALSAQASLEREKALRRTVPAPSASDDLEFADPDADEERAADAEEQQEDEESLDDELSDEDEVISAGGVMEEEDDEDADTDNGEEDVHDGAPTATFMKSPDATGLSGLLNPRRPPTGGRDGFGSRLPTPYAGSGTGVPAPSTSPFASRLSPPPSGASPPYGTRITHTQSPIPTIQVPPPSGAATTATGPSFFNKQVPMPGVWLLCFGFLALGFGLPRPFSGKSAPPVPTTIVAKPTAAMPAPATPVVEPVARPASTAAEVVRPAPTAEPIKPAPAEVAPLVQAGTEQNNAGGVEQALWKPTTKKAAPKPKKTAVEAEEEAALKPAAAAPKPPTTATPKAAPAAPKSAKKPAKAWVDPFAG